MVVFSNSGKMEKEESTEGHRVDHKRKKEFRKSSQLDREDIQRLEVMSPERKDECRVT